jgi:hypothetical protein
MAQAITGREDEPFGGDRLLGGPRGCGRLRKPGSGAFCITRSHPSPPDDTPKRPMTNNDLANYMLDLLEAADNNRSA